MAARSSLLTLLCLVLPLLAAFVARPPRGRAVAPFKILTAASPHHSTRLTPPDVIMQMDDGSLDSDDQPDPDVPSNVIDRQIHNEISDSYMAYAMSVIMSRALPDVRDGLKPVHRRILFAMHELNLQPDGPHRKCARVVGEVLGKYHPHGDNSVYDALVRMAQDFSLRAPLVDGHGNFGSIDPDPAAAMRYTECKLAPLAAEALLADVKEDVVDFGDNFDGSEVEPNVLPAKLPMLLLNGATGIAVGMATNCPPHNLGEIVDALCALIEDRELTDEALMELVPAPDFPTGGIVMGTGGARDMYTTGRGSIPIRAAAHVEPPSRAGGREAVVVTELPYGVGKTGLLERIAAMVNEKKLDGIAEIRDESSLEGMRIVFEIKRDSEPLVVLNNMYKRSSLQHTFAGNLMAVAGDGRMPELLTLRTALISFLDFRVECLLRRSRYRLKRAEDRLHLVDGLLVAQSRMDEVVATVRAAKNASDARASLESSQFGLSAAQADAILSMQLRRLTALERETLEAEGDDLRATVSELNSIIDERPRLLQLITDELQGLKEKHGSPRRTRLGSSADADLSEKDLTENEQCIIIRTIKGYMKRLPLDEFEAQQRGTRGKAGMTNMRDGDAVMQVLQCNTHQTILCLSATGVAYALPAYKIPCTSRTSRGVLAHQLLPIDETENIATVLPVASFAEDVYMVLLTRNGWIKKTPLLAFEKINARGLIAVSLQEGDSLVRADLCTLADSVLICSEMGHAVRFDTSETELRASGRQSRGVKSMSMRENDLIADFFVLPPGVAEEDDEGADEANDKSGGGQYVLAITKYGFGKRMRSSNFRRQRRGGKGVIAIKFKREIEDDKLISLSPFTLSAEGVAASPDAEEQELLLITEQGTVVRQRLARITEQGRAATGVLVQRLVENDRVASATIVPAAEEEEEEDDSIEVEAVEDE